MFSILAFWWIIALIFKGCFGAFFHSHDDYKYDR